MSDYAELVGRLEKQSVCIHIAAEPECAKDVSDGLRKAADAIKALVQERDELNRGKVLADGMANMIRGFIFKTVEIETLDEMAAKYRKWEEDYCHRTWRAKQ